ncbi:MAG: hypothetical protein LBP88_03895 [Treponema sp.]|nr:hypothetical protein [Treponema sp.]
MAKTRTIAGGKPADGWEGSRLDHGKDRTSILGRIVPRSREGSRLDHGKDRTSILGKGLAPKQQRPEARDGPLSHRRSPSGAVNPLGGGSKAAKTRTIAGGWEGSRLDPGKGFGSKAAKARSKERPVRLPPRPFTGIKPAGGDGPLAYHHHGHTGAVNPLGGGSKAAKTRTIAGGKQGTARLLTATAIHGQ